MKLLTGIFLISSVQVWAQVSPAINQQPTREFGNAKLGMTLTTQPNLVEGREFNQPTSIAFDTSASPPIVYVADISNHRILAWKNPSGLTDGSKFADKVIGQRDIYSSQANGPCTGCLTTGLNTPTAIAVDAQGNLYVADNGNNRILRYPKPFQQTSDLVQPDLVIGQKLISSGNVANRGLTAPSAITLALSANGTSALSGLAFDPQGNLWVTDSFNNRVLRYPAAQLSLTNPPVDLPADLVLGQSTFTTNAAPTGTENVQTNLRALLNPNSLAFDSTGRLYVADSYARVMYFPTPTNNGAFATRILGIQPAPAQGAQPPLYPTAYTLGNANTFGQISSFPRGLFTLGNVLFVCDPSQSRVVRYDTPENWAAATTDAPSPAAIAVYGQDNFVSGKPNRGNTQPGTSSFWEPTAGAFFGSEMWVVDNKNNRVLGFQQGAAFQYLNATRIIGQQRFDVGAPNLIEGKELFVFSSTFHGSSIVVDRSSTPNHVYVADSLNNRILGFNDVNKVGVDARSLLTATADIVIGQADFYHALANYPGGDPQIPTASGLNVPAGVALDANGNLYVADTGNGRVVRFPAPFNPANSAHTANLVLGQANFSQRITDASSNTMGAPFGVAVFNNGGLAVSDIGHNRILIFRKGGGDFVNGQPASSVLGQQNFNSTNAGGTAATLNGPRGLAVDSGDRLFVADTGNNRVIVYSNTVAISNGASGLPVNVGFNQPEGVAVSPTSGETWVADQGNNRVVRLKEFSALQLDPSNAATAVVQSALPIGVALDAFDNLLVVEATNRITFYYAQLFYQHTATYSFGTSFGPRIAPNTIVALRRLGKGFDLPTASIVGNPPYPFELGGLQILVQGIPAPIYYTGPYDVTGGAMYFIVPNNAPTSGTAEYLVRRTATGEILGAGYFDMVAAAPGFYTRSQDGTVQDGTGQVAAVNNDDATDYANGLPLKLNGPADAGHNPVGRGKAISLYLTGIGHIDGLPLDGTAPGPNFSSSLPLVVAINASPLASSDILFSGPSPQYPGLWQLNVNVPGSTPPGNKISVVVILQDLASNVGGTTPLGTDRLLVTGPTTSPQGSGNGLITTIAVK
jgi:uncharacterized protein (TIGR03437 family)